MGKDWSTKPRYKICKHCHKKKNIKFFRKNSKFCKICWKATHPNSPIYTGKEDRILKKYFPIMTVPGIISQGLLHRSAKSIYERAEGLHIKKITIKEALEKQKKLGKTTDNEYYSVKRYDELHVIRKKETGDEIMKIKIDEFFSDDQIQYYDHVTRTLTESPKKKVNTLIELDLIEPIGDGKFLIHPIPKYNTRTYTVDIYKRDCNCQNVSAQRKKGITDIGCAHIFAVIQFLRRLKNNPGGNKNG